MTDRSCPHVLPVATVVWLVLGAPLSAQTRGTLSGQVIDDLGAPLSPATVTLVSTDTGVRRPTVTEDDGSFVFGGLRPGQYVVGVDEDRFLPYVSDPVTLAPGGRAAITVVLRLSGPPTFAPPPPERQPDYIPVPNRWTLRYPVTTRYPPNTGGQAPFVDPGTVNPYRQSPLKGDFPVIGDDIFLVLTGLVETPVEFRRVPTASGVSTDRPQSEAVFGEGEQFAVLPTALVSFELFKGDTAFKPRDWAFRLTQAFNVNYNVFRERNTLHVSPEQGVTRRRQDIAIEEAFGEVKVIDVSSNYDFVSVRAGIQPFSSDFRGFLYRDINLGVRTFGNWGSNRNQWNVAYFDQLEKETNSELNLLTRRAQTVFIANWYRQDTFVPGYTLTASFHSSRDQSPELFYDENGFLVRPAPIGVVAPHDVESFYAGVGGDGHWGRLNINHQFYQAWGHDDLNGIAGRGVDINAQFAAVEASVDKDWWRLKGTFVWASGDDNPLDDKARGFDSIFDNPNIIGGPFSFWNREGLRLTQTLVGLVGRESILPSLRASKTEGQANFVNPGVVIYNVGLEADLTTKLRAFANGSYLRFDTTEVLQTVLFQSEIDKAIGIDYSVGFEYRPWLNDNATIQSGVSVLTPSHGFENILTSDTLYTPFVVLTLAF
ncbi:MAG: carboxypeptidase-like regulatory domain-containing protein [Acidobacteria bacterium]|nr:carboxypeptidase-like regulatory domain-containing protein [Acidobacteriota bacterium]